jgi:nicotinamide-nucleotide amidase
MEAILIAIGDEILIGQILDSNSNFISKNLHKAGVEVKKIMAIRDQPSEIVNNIDLAFKEVDLVVMTGGLGPTKDDLTKKTLSDYFEDDLEFNPPVMDHITDLFAKMGRIPSELNRGQAMLPKKATIFHNQYGTAPGMLLKKGEKIAVSLPGVPFEMKALLKDQVLPWIDNNLTTTKLLHKTVLTYGLPESDLAEKIADWENALPAEVKLAYLPSPSRVRLRLSIKGDDLDEMNRIIDEQIKILYTYIEDNIFGFDEENIEEIVAEKLKNKSLTISLSESFTGGKLASMLTSVPGSSAYFKGGVVTYSSDSKIDILGVSKSTIDKYTVVSKEVALEMAYGAKNKFNSDIAISTTGVAGPDRGEDGKEPGIAVLSIVSDDFEFVKEYKFGQPRDKMQGRALSMALDVLRKYLDKKNE